MVSKKYWDKLVSEFVAIVKKETEEKLVKVLGITFKVLPNVFSPIYSSDTAWFAKKIIPLVKNKRFLEIGSGTGVIACLASINEASQVVATDINPTAIKNIKLNSKLHSLNISIRKGCVFDPIYKNELFDIIFWNHPFNYSNESSPKDDLIHASVFDTKYHALRKFFQQGKHHLTKNGRLLLGTSNIARIRLIQKIAKKEGFKMSLLEKVIVPVFKDKKIKMDLRIYSLSF